MSTPAGAALLRIGQLAKQTGESNATIRYWTKEGLLEVADTTESGYQLYDTSMIERIQSIRDLQSRRLTLAEIKDTMWQLDYMTTTLTYPHERERFQYKFLNV